MVSLSKPYMEPLLSRTKTKSRCLIVDGRVCVSAWRALSVMDAVASAATAAPQQSRALRVRMNNFLNMADASFKMDK